VSQAVTRSGFDPTPVHVGFIVDEVSVGQVFSPSTSLFP
jgi:hypothetical protein